MDLRFAAEDEAFRAGARAWLEDALTGDFSTVRGRGGPGDEHALFEARLAWEQHLGACRWTCVGWPTECGGRGLSLHQQVIWFEEYARARGPGRLGQIGEGLIGPTLIAYGNEDQQERFLPGIRAGTELWSQGFSEPDAGSDLANLSTHAERDGDDWVLSGQKVWTSLAHWSEWCFVLARTDRDAPRHKGISFFLVSLRQPGVEVRPIRQITGTCEFNEVFFDRARVADADLVGGVNDGWTVAMGLLGFERGASTLGQQLAFRNELDAVVEAARANGRIHEPVIRQRIAHAHAGLEIQRWTALRVLSGDDASGPLPVSPLPVSPIPASTVTKLHWASWHRSLGELAIDVLGPDALLADGPDLSAVQRLFLFSRSDTIYGGSNQIQRNIIGERALGLPREPR